MWRPIRLRLSMSLWARKKSRFAGSKRLIKNTLAIVIGFPIALILAWAFELTPEGLKRTEFADELPKKSSRNRVWIYVVIIAGAMSIALFFLGHYTAQRTSPAENGRPGGPSLPD